MSDTHDEGPVQDAADGTTALGDRDLIVSSDLFDAAWYRRTYQGVAVSDLEAAEHYLTHGVAEDRDPGPRFNSLLYLETNPDVAGAGLNPLVHYLKFGRAEGRGGAVVGTHLDLIERSGLFDAAWYRAANPDVAAGGLDPLWHFSRYGLREGRSPNAYFDARWYEATYPDVVESGSLPLLHYVVAGADEDRWPSASFSGKWYRTQIPPEELGDESPLAHYIRIGRARRLRAVDPNESYRSSMVRDYQRTAAERPEIVAHIAVMPFNPHFRIIVDGHHEEGRAETLASLDAQLYRGFSVVEAAAVDSAGGTPERPAFLIWLQAGDVLYPKALYAFASRYNADISLDIIYGDEDQVLEGLRCNPFYKPDWSPDTLESFNYFGSVACFRLTSCFEHFRSAKGYYDFVLRVTEHGRRIAHVRSILGRGAAGFLYGSMERIGAEAEALRGRMARTARHGSVVPLRENSVGYAVRSDLRRRPLVSVVVQAPAHGDEERSADSVLMGFIDAVRYGSSYDRTEIVVVDDGIQQGRYDRELGRRRVTRVSASNGGVGLAARMNLGVAQARGEVLLLMDEPSEPQNGDWIERLLEQLEKAHVGAVGARMLDRDGACRHLGVVMASGTPARIQRPLPADEDGYFLSTCTPRNYLAVSGACLMTPRSLYDRVGGYDEAMPGSCSAIDYCLRIGQEGLYVVYTPFATLRSWDRSGYARGPVVDLDGRFALRWAALTTDPFYNEDCLSNAPPSFEVQHRRERAR